MRRIERVSAVVLALALASQAHPTNGSEQIARQLPEQKGSPTMKASGPFDVKVAPAAQEQYPEGSSTGRFSIDKQYHGDLEATAKGEMLTAGTPVAGSASYVAIERVAGTLAGRQGTFMLQHLGMMGHGAQKLDITVVPDSGTGELVGMAGRLDIQIAAGGKHSYVLEYSLPVRE